MNEVQTAFSPLRRFPGFRVHHPQSCGGRAAAALALTLVVIGSLQAVAHPGSGIVVDRLGRVYFTDTGQGVWKIDERGRVTSHEGPAYHWMAIDLDGRVAGGPWPSFVEPSVDIRRIGANPTLLLSSDFPLTTDRDGTLYYPELGQDNQLRVYRVASSGERRVLATIPKTADGDPLHWLNGMAAGPDGSVYFSENAAVRRITRQGVLSTMAGGIVVANASSPPGASPRLGPFLRGLDVTDDGTVYVAANGSCAVLKVSAQGQVSPVLRAISPWSPTGVAVHGNDIRVLEYLHTASGDRREWTPRVRRISPDGSVAIIAAIERAGPDRSRAAQLPPSITTNFFSGTQAGAEKTVAGIRLGWCPPGTFRMGSPPDESERRPGEDQVQVTLSRGFWMAKFEATQGEWKRIMGELPGPLTAELPAGDELPVGNVNFAQAEAFCAKLTELARRSGELPTDWEFRLPTEAQWEYACRAGTMTATSFGDSLSSRQANFKGKPYNGGEPGPALGRAVKVGLYPANAWGLHDMHGNTFEWCRDWYHARLPGGVDPDLYAAESTAVLNRTGDRSRVRRGGAWTDDGWACRSAFRLRFEPHRGYDHIGFRVVIVQLQPLAHNPPGSNDN